MLDLLNSVVCYVSFYSWFGLLLVCWFVVGLAVCEFCVYLFVLCFGLDVSVCFVFIAVI